MSTHKTVWWIEGLAEWVSWGGEGGPVAERVEDVGGTVPALSDVMSADYFYSDLYPRSHLAVGFILERHPEDVLSLLEMFRARDYDA